MKLLSRDFNGKERILLIFLSIVLVGLVYYYLVDQPVRTALNTCEAEQNSIQTELDSVNLQILRLEQMQAELESIRGSSSISIMASYNNSKEELKLLNDALRDTTKFAITFADVTRDGNQIRRDFTLQFTAPSYNSMKAVISELAVSPYRCLIGDISCSNTRRSDNTSEVQVSATATFYETMVGGVPDAGLPADTSEEDESTSAVDNAIVGSTAAEVGQNELEKGELSGSKKK